jgi:hypothetical protein
MELTENSSFRLFAPNGKRKRQTSVCLLQKETENGSLFPLVGIDKLLSIIVVSANVPFYRIILSKVEK